MPSAASPEGLWSVASTYGALRGTQAVQNRPTVLSSDTSSVEEDSYAARQVSRLSTVSSWQAHQSVDGAGSLSPSPMAHTGRLTSASQASQDLSVAWSPRVADSSTNEEVQELMRPRARAFVEDDGSEIAAELEDALRPIDMTD